MNTTTGADSPTPRTDALLFGRLCYIKPENDMLAMYDHARQLERELTEARAEVERLKAEADNSHKVVVETSGTVSSYFNENATLRAQCAALEQDNARLDWLAHNPLVFGMVTIPCPDGRPGCLVHHQRRQNAEEIRAAIDAAKEAKP